MTTAAEIIRYLQRRAQLRAHLMPPPGEFPAGWKQWFAAMKLQPGRVTGAPAEEIVGEIARRAPAAPSSRVFVDLTRWQAFSTLWRQEWQSAEPEDREERRVRVVAGTISALCHVFFAGMLLWLMYVQYLVATPPPPGEDVVQVEYIGTGTPEEAGGGEPAPAAPSPARRASARAPSPEPAGSTAAPPVPSVATETPRSDAPLPDVPQRDVPEPVVPPAAVEQVVTVSEPTPTTEPDAFLLPPPQPRIAEVPIAAPELRVPSHELQVAEVPAPVQPIQPELPQPAVEAPRIESRMPEVMARDVPAPLPQAPIREIAAPTVELPELAASTLPVRGREIPAPAGPAPATEATTAADPVASGSGPASSTKGAPSSRSAASNEAAPGRSGTGPAATTAGVGPDPTPSPGGWPSPRRADDWGDSTRDVPGGQRGDPSGLFGSDGSVRLADTPGSASPGRPPGTVTDEIVNLDRAGTWLKRKPIDYEPTAFDRYWLPHETLLAEWVRRGVKEVAIPIPGTGKNIVCVVSLLQLGGGCGIGDPNLNEQPAVARPPPDIPFKPHLQEDNGSARP